MIRKDAQGRNTILNLDYFNGFFLLNYKKDYLDMNIHEKIITRTAYCGNTAPSLMIKKLIKSNKELNLTFC